MKVALDKQLVAAKEKGTAPGLRILDQEQIRKKVKTLCSWSQGSKYYAYFNWLPLNFDPYEGLADKFDDIKSSKHYKYDAWALDNREWGITFTMPEGAIFETLPDQRGVFVYLDGIGGAVPVRAAQVFAHGFTNGLAARLSMAKIADSARLVEADPNKPRTLREDSPIFGEKFLDMQIESQFGGGRSNFINPQEFSGVKTASDFDRCVEKLLISNDLTAYGMAWGWKAGSEILSEKAAGEDKYYNAAMDLIRGRFSIKQIGTMTSYTLCYLSGFSYGQNFKSQLAAGSEVGLAAAEVSQKGNEFERNVKALTTEIGTWLLTGIEASYASDGTIDKERAVAMDFLLGWHEGMSNTTSDIYGSVYNLSFSLGYEKGYKLGYDAGFQAGFQDTYQAAYNEEFKQFANQITDLQSQINKAQKEGKYWGLAGTAVGAGIGLVVKFFTGGLF